MRGTRCLEQERCRMERRELQPPVKSGKQVGALSFHSLEWKNKGCLVLGQCVQNICKNYVNTACGSSVFGTFENSQDEYVESPRRGVMKLNERSVAHYATCDSPPDKTGFLFKKGERNTAYHRRWFILKGNMLFYFEDRESREPIGVIVLEGCTVELCESVEEFAFAIKFDCAKARVYKLAAESQAGMESWVKALSRASFDYMRLVVRELERQLEEMQEAGGTGSQNRSRLSRKPSQQTSRPKAFSPPGTTAVTAPWHGRAHHEEILLLPSSSRENGVAWSKPSSLPNCSKGPASSLTWEGNDSSYGMGPPPVPPRRRGASGFSVSSMESPVSPGTVCFAKLHDWYGKEVADLRLEWLQSQ
ncbi:sesquipedalian-1 [Arapaima gigas]